MGFTNGTTLLTVLILALNFIAIAAQFDSPSPDTNSSNEDDTVRVDPLDNFNKYRGGFDITNKHYWASVVFTGIYGFAIAFSWLLCGFLYGIYLLAIAYCCRRSRKPRTKSVCHKQCYLWPFLLAIIFTIFTLVASGLALGGTVRFHSEAKTVVDIVIRTANGASETIYNTTGAMKEMRDSLGDTDATGQASTFLTTTSRRLDIQADDIARQARRNRRLIERGLKIVFIVTTVTISLNMVAVIALSVTGILRIRRALYWLIGMCWILTILCWLFFGVYFFLEKFSGDTCTALENFQENPYNNTLSSILPCDELLSAESVLSDVSAGIYNLVNEVNSNISQLQATTYPTLSHVCNPFSAPPEYTYQPNNCPANTIRIGDIPEILKVFTCSDANNGTCQEGQFISSNDYKTVEAYTSSIQNLLNVYPGVENLVQCRSVKDAFSEILSQHCRPWKRSARISWAAMVLLSVVMFKGKSTEELKIDTLEDKAGSSFQKILVFVQSVLTGTSTYFAMKDMGKALLTSRKKLLRVQTERERESFAMEETCMLSDKDNLEGTSQAARFYAAKVLTGVSAHA
ncbi:putative HXXXD-type acyl-transferase family protein [Hibiscus syriacus]|uniref:HXXXD-type acyl-transferase family protein n=1 Tax=Hibiscus syriacus TaxID=106335 RepID=A0A6A3BN17_HIBSY|nr:putative HXXXD-type acyl-transferase family protein [Hibiscus syriacus]